MKKINIIGYINGVGLSRDASILASVLIGAGFQVTINNHDVDAQRRSAGTASRLLSFGRKVVKNRMLRRPLFDVNILLEQISSAYLPLARVNCLIPNPEWFHDWYRTRLPDIDLVLCKTTHAQEIFSALGCRTEKIGFTSLDRWDPAVPRGPTFFHLAGNSTYKGTRTVVQLWKQHPEWPQLTVVQNPRKAHPVSADNINFVLDFIDDAVLRRLQNQNAIHLCTSETEGFGHYIVEALSCGAITIATDAPPMNELVRPEHGVLVQHASSTPHNLAHAYTVAAEDLERKVETVLTMDTKSLARTTFRARRWYEENDQRFRYRLPRVIAGL